MSTTKNTSRRGSTLMFAVALVTLVVPLIGGCAGHGTHTAKSISEAERKWSLIKSATEWDMARQAYLAGDLEKALERVNRSLAINESVTKSHVLRGRILIELGDLESAMNSFLKAEAIDPTFVEAQYYLGIVHERYSQEELAVERYRKANVLDPSNPQYVIAAAEVMMAMGNYDQAEAFLHSQSATFEHNAGVRQTLGHVAMIQEDFPKAVTMFSEARLLAPEDAAIIEDLARAQVALGDYSTANFNLSTLSRIADYQNRRDIMHLQATCLIELDRPVEARKVLLALTSGTSGQADTEAWIMLGQISYQLHDLGRVTAAATQIIAQAPNRPEGFILRAMWQKEKGSLKAAVISLDKAITRSSGDPTALIAKGLILEEMGEYAQASRTFALASTLDTQNAAALSQMSQQAAVKAQVASVPE